MKDDITEAELHMLTGVWALNALSPEECGAFEVHLAQCASCAAEAAELRETAARLGAVAEVAPPPELRQRVLAATAEIRQLPPETGEVHLITRPTQVRRRTVLRRAGVLAAAAGVAAAMVLGVQAVQSNRQLEREVNALQQVTAAYDGLLTASDTKLVTRPVEGGGTGTAVFSPSHGKVLFLADGLSALPEGSAYQLWLIGPDGPRSAGMMPSASHAAPMVADGVTGIEKVAVTVEPRRGSPGPTTSPVVVIPFT